MVREDPPVQGQDTAPAPPEVEYPLHQMAGLGSENLTCDEYIVKIEDLRLKGVPTEISNGMTAFHAAVITGNDEYLRALLLTDNFCDGGGGYDIKDNKGRTPFSYACEEGNMEIVKMLMSLTRGTCDIVSKDKKNISPLGYASGGGHIEIARLLLRSGVDANF